MKEGGSPRCLVPRRVTKIGRADARLGCLGVLSRSRDSVQCYTPMDAKNIFAASPPLSFRRSTPDPVLDPVLQRVLEAFDLDRATGADFAGMVDTHAVGGEEERRFPAAAVAIEHPHVLGVVIRKRVVIHLVSATVGDAGWFPELLSVWSQVWLEL